MIRLRKMCGDRLGFVPGAIAVMGKWEPFLRAERCLEEVAARAAAALALSEALEPDGPGLYLLSAEAKLRGQPRAGCLLAAEILLDLGASPARIRCSAAANRTRVELGVLRRMGQELGAGGLLLLTAAYHVSRTRHLLMEHGPGSLRLEVIACDDPLIETALASLSPARRGQLTEAIHKGRRRSLTFAPLALNEAFARLGARYPLIEGLLADLVRGPSDPTAVMLQPPHGRPRT